MANPRPTLTRAALHVLGAGLVVAGMTCSATPEVSSREVAASLARPAPIAVDTVRIEATVGETVALDVEFAALMDVRDLEVRFEAGPGVDLRAGPDRLRLGDLSVGEWRSTVLHVVLTRPHPAHIRVVAESTSRSGAPRSSFTIPLDVVEGQSDVAAVDWRRFGDDYLIEIPADR